MTSILLTKWVRVKSSHTVCPKNLLCFKCCQTWWFAPSRISFHGDTVNIKGFMVFHPFVYICCSFPQFLKGNPRHQNVGLFIRSETTRDTAWKLERTKRILSEIWDSGWNCWIWDIIWTRCGWWNGGIVNSKPTGTPKFYCFITMALFVVADGSSISLLEQWRVEIVQLGKLRCFHGDLNVQDITFVFDLHL